MKVKSLKKEGVSGLDIKIVNLEILVQFVGSREKVWINTSEIDFCNRGGNNEKNNQH